MSKFEQFEADARTWWQKFKNNVYRIWAYATAWATTVWAGIWAWWASMDKSDQVALVGNYIAANKVPVVLAVGTVASFVIAKGWPQPKQTEMVAAKVEQTKELAAPMVVGKPAGEPTQPMNDRRG